MRILFFLLFSILASSFTYGQIELIKDINPGGTSSIDLFDTDEGVTIGQRVFFIADDGTHGREIWTTLGLETDISILKDIYVGSEGSEVSKLTRFKTDVFFFANDNINGLELWKSDGTESGTQLFKDVISGSTGLSDPSIFVTEDHLFISSANSDLWISDGTESGTQSLGAMEKISTLTAFDGTYYFTVEEPQTQFWKTDGTSAGTELVKVINDGSVSSSAPAFLEVVNNVLVFDAYTTTAGKELWSSDGTETGTQLLKDVNPGTSSAITFLTDFLTVNEQLYVSVDDGTNGFELWKTDGTESGTQLVRDIRVGNEGAFPADFANYNGQLYFAANEGDTGENIWKTDGTDAGTVLVKDVFPNNNSSSPITYGLTPWQDSLYFFAFVGAEGRKLWVSDGTDTGTRQIPDKSFSDGGVQNPVNILTSDHLLYFYGAHNVFGMEFWRYKIPLKLTVETSNNPQLCFGEVSTISPVLTGGYPPFTYTWFDGAMVVSEDDMLNNATEGSYQLFVSDGLEEVVQTSIFIEGQDEIQLDFMTSPVTTTDGGTARVDAIGGVLPYTYTWNTTPPSTTMDISELEVGWYTVTVTDANQCEQVDSVFIDFLENTQQLNNGLELSVSPNPASSVVQVELLNNVFNAFIEKVKMYNTQGQEVYRSNALEGVNTQHTINLNALPKGVYFLQLKIDNQMVTKKIILQ